MKIERYIAAHEAGWKNPKHAAQWPDTLSRRAFLPGATGAKRQTFCRLACRRAFDAAGRRWVAEATPAGC